MSPTPPFSGIAGVRGYAVGDIGGNVVATDPPNHGSGETIAATAIIGNAFSAIGSLLGMGEVTIITIRGEQGSSVVAYLNGYSLAVDLDANMSTATVEQAVLRGNWMPKVEWEVAPADIKYVSPAVSPPRPRSAPPPKPQTNSNPIALVRPLATSHDAAVAEVARPQKLPFESSPVDPLSSHKPTAPRRHNESVKPNQPSVAPSLVSANARGLRRALIRGDLKAAQSIADHLKGAFPSKTDPCGSGPSARAIAPLISGIAAALSGDNDAALVQFDLVRQMNDIGPSLSWVALVWTVRANVGMAEGLDNALTNAEAAGRLSKQMDIETRVISARLIAEVCLHRQHLDHAERFIEQARRLSESLADRDESGEITLLQARILLAAGKRDQAIQAAERAHVYRQYWGAPIAFLCRCALATGDVTRARSLIASSRTSNDVPPEVLWIDRLLTAVQQSGLPPVVAAELLELEDSPPSSRCIGRLQVLSEAFPKLETIGNMLGWKLLKARRRGDASAVFTRLSERLDLPDDVRSSVLLALGFLAARAGNHPNTGAKIRATVNAAPRHLQSNKEPARSSSHLRCASPVEFASIEPPPPSVTATTLETGGDGGGKNGQPSPVFSGNLNHFCLQDVLEFLRVGRRTGTLLCSSVRGIGAVHLRFGAITGAAAPNTASLKDMLIARGKLTVEVAEKAVATQQTASPPLPFGSVLVAAGWASTEDVASCLRAQITGAISELLRWGEGQFAFDPDESESVTSKHVEVALDPQAVLLDIYKDMDEQSRDAT